MDFTPEGSIFPGPLRPISTNQSSGGLIQQARPEMTRRSCRCPCSGQHHLALGFSEGSHQRVDIACSPFCTGERGRFVQNQQADCFQVPVSSCPGPA